MKDLLEYRAELTKVHVTCSALASTGATHIVLTELTLEHLPCGNWASTVMAGWIAEESFIRNRGMESFFYTIIFVMYLSLN